MFPPRWMRLLALGAFALLAAALLRHGAGPDEAATVPAPWDPLGHLLVYAGVCAAAWVMLGAGRYTADVLAPMAATAIGLIEETAQALEPGRQVGLGELAAGAAGAVLAAMLLASARRARSRGSSAGRDRAAGAGTGAPTGSSRSHR